MPGQDGDLNTVLPASPTRVKHGSLVQTMAATDIQSVFRGFRWRRRWRANRGLRGSVRDLAASTVQTVVRNFLSRRSTTPTAKPWRQTAEVRGLAALSLQSLYRGHRIRRSTQTLDTSDVDCAFTASASSQASSDVASSVEDLLRYSHSDQGGEEGSQASQTDAASVAHEAASADRASPLRESIEAASNGLAGGMGEGEEDEALSLALSINGPAEQGHVATSANALGASPEPSPSVDRSLEDGRFDAEPTNPAREEKGGGAGGQDHCLRIASAPAVPLEDPVMPAPLQIGAHVNSAAGPMGQVDGLATGTPHTAGRMGKGGRGGRAVLLVKMARERKHAVQAAYRHACDVVCGSVSLREAELRIVLHGINVTPPPQPRPPLPDLKPPRGQRTRVPHRLGAVTWRLTFPLSPTMAATAEALRAACVRLGLGRGLAHSVTNKKADVARRQLLRIIKGAGSVQRVLLERCGHGNSTPISDWTHATVTGLLQSLEVPPKALTSTTLLRGGSALLLPHNELAADLCIGSTILRKRLELLQHSLHGVDQWESSGLWPGTLPFSPLPPTRLSSTRHRLSKSLASASASLHAEGGTEDEAPGHRRAETLPLPLPPNMGHDEESDKQAAESTADRQGEDEGGRDTWQPLSTEGLARMNLATVKKGNYCIVAPTEEVCRVFRAAWRAHGFGDRVDLTNGEGSVRMEDAVRRLVATQVGHRPGRVLSTRSALPSYSFVKVEVYRPVDASTSAWVLEPSESQRENEEGDTKRIENVDVVELPLRALFHAPAGLVKPHIFTVLRLGHRVRVCEGGRLRDCLDQATHTWVDNESMYTDLLALAGQHAEVICLREAGPPLHRVGLRTATGLEDAMPLCALDPLTSPPTRRTKGHKRRRTLTTLPPTVTAPKPAPLPLPSTPHTPSLPHPRSAHRRRHSAPHHYTPVDHPLPTEPCPSLPSPPLHRSQRPGIFAEASGDVTLAGSKLVPTPPPSPPPLAFPTITSRLSRLPQRAPPSGADLLDLVDAIDGLSAPPTADNDRPLPRPIAVEVRQLQREREGQEDGESDGYEDDAARSRRVRRRSMDAPPQPQHCHRRTSSVPPPAFSLHKHTLTLSPVKLSFPLTSRDAAVSTQAQASTTPHRRPAPSLTMNKAPLASKPRPASASHTRRASWGGSASPPAHSRKPSSSSASSSGVHAPPRPRSASDTAFRSSRWPISASYGRPSDGDDGLDEPGSLPWQRDWPAHVDGHEQLGRGQESGPSNNDHEREREEHDSREREEGEWSSRWSEVRDRPIYRRPHTPTPHAPAQASVAHPHDKPTHAPAPKDHGPRSDVRDTGRRLRDGKAFVRRRRGSQSSSRRSDASVLEEVLPDAREGKAEVSVLRLSYTGTESGEGPSSEAWAAGPEGDGRGIQADDDDREDQEFMRPRASTSDVLGNKGRRGSDVYVVEDGRRKSLEAKLRAIERQSQARMAKINKVVERLRASTHMAAL